MQTIGERLEEARKKKGISIREAAEATKIRGEYLQKFEGNQFDIGLTDLYTRGFIRGYATFLKLPADRILSDYSAVRGGEPRIRQPSREVYGRMDLGISNEDAGGPGPAEAQQEPAPKAGQTRFQRPGENLPKPPPIDPTLVFKGGIVLVVLCVVLIAFWVYRSIAGSGSAAPVARPAAPVATEVAEAPVAQASSVTIVGLEPVRIKVVRKSDGVELYQGPLQAGERREFANVPLYLTASELASVELEYKGRRYPTGHTGHDRIQFDFTGR